MQWYQITPIIDNLIEHYLQVENTEDGLLEDVETINIGFNNEFTTDTPFVWVFPQATTDYDSNINISNRQKLVDEYVFLCCHEADTMEDAEKNTRELSARVAQSILKNINKTFPDTITPQHIFHYARIKQRFGTDEYVNVMGKREKLPTIALVMEFVYTVEVPYCR